MLMRLRASHRAAVIEMGMNHPGEIATLAAMAQPTVALVNNAQREHLEFMHTVEAVARETVRCLPACPPMAWLCFLQGMPTPAWAIVAMQQPGRRTVTFGDGGDVRCAGHLGARRLAVTLATPRGEITTCLPSQAATT